MRFVGSSYSRAEAPIKELIEKHQLPFLPTPMGKGVVPDDSSFCVASARSRYIQSLKIEKCSFAFLKI